MWDIEQACQSVLSNKKNYKIKQCVFSYEDLLTIFDYFNISDEEILYIMKLNERK